MKHIETETTIERYMIEQAARNSLPINGSLELLPLCNMNCDMCYVHLSRDEMEHKGRLRTVDEWISLGGAMANAGVLFLQLTGGEPLLFPGFRELFCELKKLGMVLTINTNGTLIDEDWADFFSQHKPRRVNITLYGSSDDAYTSLCHYPGGFEKVIHGIRLLKERGIKVKINGSITRDNVNDLDAIYRIGRELGAPVSIDTYMLPGVRERGLDFSMQARLEPELAARAEWNVLQRDMAPDVFQDYVTHCLEIIAHPKADYPDCISCMASNCSFAINWQGEMRPCVALEEPSIPVFETGFLPAWRHISQEAKKFRLHKKCTTCYLRPICNTCVASAWLETGYYDGLPEYLCRYTAELFRLMDGFSKS